jgi:predicted phage replisome organizer
LATKVEWIKLSTEMFSNAKINYIRSLPSGNDLVLLWVMLLTKAGKCNANGFILLIEDIPYTSEMLANEFNFDTKLVQMGLGIFQKLKMISLDNDTIYVEGWSKHQNVQSLEKIKESQRLRTQRYREKQKQLPNKNLEKDTEQKEEQNSNVTCDVTPSVTSNVTLYIERENKENKNNKHIEQINLLWSLYPHKKGKVKAIKKLPALIEKYGYEQIKRCIERYAKEKEGKALEFIAHGSTFFNTSFVDYLDENYTPTYAEQAKARQGPKQDPVTGEILD